MRFSDLMGGSETDDPASESGAAGEAIIEPFLEDDATVEEPPHDESTVESVEVAAAGAPWAASAPDLPALPQPPAPTASFDVAAPLDDSPPRRSWQPDRPVAPSPAPAEVGAAIATAVADLAPLSDDLLPRRR